MDHLSKPKNITILYNDCRVCINNLQAILLRKALKESGRYISSLHRNYLYDIFYSVWEMGEMKLQVSRNDISYLRFILEGYDGLGIVTTKDPARAEVIITYPAKQKALLAQLIEALHKEGLVKEGISK